MTEFLDRIAAAPVTASLLNEAADAAQAFAEREGSNRQPLDPTTLVALHFRGRGLSSVTLAAIAFRMEALSQLILDGELRHWQLGQTADDGGVTISGTTFEAAAQARLLLDAAPGAKPRFEPQPFRDLLLSLAVTTEDDANGSH